MGNELDDISPICPEEATRARKWLEEHKDKFYKPRATPIEDKYGMRQLRLENTELHLANNVLRDALSGLMHYLSPQDDDGDCYLTSEAQPAIQKAWNVLNNSLGARDKEVELLKKALRDMIELAQGFNDADTSIEEGEEPIVAPYIAAARKALGEV